MRFATFNLENLFARPRVLKLESWKEGEPILKAFAEFNSRIEKVTYTEANKDRMKELLLKLEVYRLDNGVVRRNRIPDPKWAWLRANRGTFDVEHEDTGIEIVANSRYDWTGWLELAKEPIDEVTTNMTAQVLLDVKRRRAGRSRSRGQALSRPFQQGLARQLVPSMRRNRCSRARLRLFLRNRQAVPLRLQTADEPM